MRHAAMSIAIGAAISFLTVMFQAAIAWLHHIQPEAPGALVGIAHYVHKTFQARYS